MSKSGVREFLSEGFGQIVKKMQLFDFHSRDCGMCGKCDSSVLGLRHVREKFFFSIFTLGTAACAGNVISQFRDCGMCGKKFFLNVYSRDCGKCRKCDFSV
jgi:hypothetical protein